MADETQINVVVAAVDLVANERMADVRQMDADHYSVTAMIRTADGARTSFFIPQTGQLYVAVPHRGAQGAELRVFGRVAD